MASDSYSQASSKKSDTSRKSIYNKGSALSAVVESFTIDIRHRLQASMQYLPRDVLPSDTQRSEIPATCGFGRSDTYNTSNSTFQLSSTTTAFNPQAEGRPQRLHKRPVPTACYKEESLTSSTTVFKHSVTENHTLHGFAITPVRSNTLPLKFPHHSSVTHGAC